MTLSAVLTGCATSESGRSGERRVSDRSSVSPSTNAPAVLRIRPNGAGMGYVTAVDRRLGFVVIDYRLSLMPLEGQDLPVFRGSEGVGRLRIAGLAREGFVTGRILQGELAVGDWVGTR